MRRFALQSLLLVLSLGMIAPAALAKVTEIDFGKTKDCLLYTSPSPRDS